MTEVQIAELMYLKEQVLILAKFAVRDTGEIRELQKAATMVSETTIAEKNTDFDKLKEEYIETLHYLSSLVDKTKSGGWIADRSAVYRVEFYGREYRNTDMIQVSMTDRDHNGAEGNFKRAREIASALNAGVVTLPLDKNDLSRDRSIDF